MSASQRRRTTVAIVACALVIAGTGVAFALQDDDAKAGRVHVAAEVPDSSSSEPATTNASTSTSEVITTTPTAPDAPPTAPVVVEESTTTLPLAPVQTTDLEGTLTLASTTLIADQDNAFTLTVRNTADHAVSFDGSGWLGVWIDGVALAEFTPEDRGRNVSWVGVQDFELAAGEQRSFTSPVTPTSAFAGTSGRLRAVVVHTGGSSVHFFYPLPEYIAAVPSVPISIVPPDQVEGQPLDPTLGKWSATLSADASSVHIGEGVLVHAVVRNTGSHPQRTNGFGSLAISCRAYGDPEGLVLPALTIAPGAAHTFTMELRPDYVFERDITCAVGLTFHGNIYRLEPRGVVGEPVTIRVLPASPTTTAP